MTVDKATLIAHTREDLLRHNAIFKGSPERPNTRTPEHPHFRNGVRSALIAVAVVLFMLPGCVRRQMHATSHALPRAGSPIADETTRPSAMVKGIRFENVTERAGLHYRWPLQPRPLRILEAFGRGCAFLDYDNDGWLDILLVASPHPVLYHNRGNGQFEDVTEAAGLASLRGDWRGCAVGDYDGDGYIDIVLTGYKRLALLHNVSNGSNGGRRFTDVTVAAGLDPANRGHWGSSAGFMDLAGQGRLDLVLLNYVVFGPKDPQFCEVRAGVRSGCPPSTYHPQFGELWRNPGNG